MVGLLIITHGSLGEALISTAEMVLGPLESALSLDLKPGASLSELRGQILSAVEGLDSGEGVLILVDLFGGTPSNVSIPLLGTHQVEVLTGVNLPMVLSLGASRGGRTLKEVTMSALSAGQASMRLPREVLGLGERDG